MAWYAALPLLWVGGCSLLAGTPSGNEGPDWGIGILVLHSAAFALAGGMHSRLLERHGSTKLGWSLALGFLGPIFAGAVVAAFLLPASLIRGSDQVVFWSAIPFVVLVVTPFGYAVATLWLGTGVWWIALRAKAGRARRDAPEHAAQ